MPPLLSPRSHRGSETLIEDRSSTDDSMSQEQEENSKKSDQIKDSTPFNFDQHRIPKKGDIIIAELKADAGWERIELTSGKIRGHPHFYNCRFQDKKEGSIQLLPGKNLSFQEIVPIQPNQSKEKENSNLPPISHMAISTDLNDQEIDTTFLTK